MELFTSNKIVALEETDSTNKYAAKLPFDAAEGTVIVSSYQTQGRGQGSNYWESEAGMNLTFSIILKPEFLKASDQFYISKIISLSIADLLSRHTGNISIKWPNDIYAGDKKISGILIENSVSGFTLMQCIVGIGININQEKFTSNAPNPVSLRQITKESHNLNEILSKFLSIIEEYYNILKNGDFNSIDKKYLKYLYRYKQESGFIADGKSFRGRIIGVEPTGELIIEDEKGYQRKFMYKEVEFVI
jgi:BirA family transcriptional regulator, biotin operon repressor / biotin---[acetyl-CoA-carboxylase] ligase